MHYNLTDNTTTTNTASVPSNITVMCSESKFYK